MPTVVKEARATLTLALPIIVGQVGQMLLGITDSAMIGRVGTVPLAAAAFTNSVFGFFFIVGIGLLVPVAVLVSRERGADNVPGCAEWLRHGMAIAWVAGLLGAGFMALTATQLHRFGQPPEVTAIVTPFFLIIASTVLPVLLFQTLRQFAESLGRPWIPMSIMLGEVVLNAFLNWVLIYGNLGAPRLGLVGAGIGTLVARWTGVVTIWIWLRGADEVRPFWPEHWRGALSLARFKEMAHIGVPAAGMLVFEVGAFSAAALMMGRLGTQALAAHQIALSCAAFTFMFPLGLSTATSMRMSQAVGEGRRERLRPIGFGALGMSTVIMGAFAVVFSLAGRPLAEAFVNDGAVIDLAAHLLVVAAVFQIFDGGQVIGAGALRGLADVRVPAVVTLIAYWGIALPGGWFFGVRQGQPLAIWISLAGGLAFAAIMLGWRLARLTRAGGRV